MCCDNKTPVQVEPEGGRGGGGGGGAPFSDYLRAAKFYGIIRVAAAKMHVKN